jgi:hypothetical protein
MTDINKKAESFQHIGWKYYHSIRKKAMEQESSWSGLLISLSIAFFIVFVSSQTMNLAYEAMTAKKVNGKQGGENIYYLENTGHINTGVMESSTLEYIELSLNKYKA